jgi:putative membrane protein
VSFVAGLAVIWIALGSPLAAHDEDVRVHVIQHLLLGMLAPLLLALAAPVTLLLRALPPRRRRSVVGILHTPPLRVLGHPAVGACLSVGSLYALYFTPLYGAAQRSEPLHVLLHAHMLFAGALFTWAVVGLDPMPYRPAIGLRSATIVAVLAAHAILSKLLYAHAGSLAGAGSSADDWRQAAQILWYGGDAVDAGLLVAFFGQRYALAGRRLARARDVATAVQPGERTAPRRSKT